jgi:plasmid stability protein
MITVTVKNIPQELYARLKQQAEANRRSLNSEIIFCLEQSVTSKKVDPNELIAQARRIRELTAGYLISDDEFNEAKNSGRL